MINERKNKELAANLSDQQKAMFDFGFDILFQDYYDYYFPSFLLHLLQTSVFLLCST